MIRVCRIEDLPPGESIRVADGVPTPIAFFNADGTVYAIDGACAHHGASSAAGRRAGWFIECPLHTASFDLRTGHQTCPPVKGAVRTHRVLVEDGYVKLHVTVGEPA
jgi:3-phenylpropionate/trans-cinnamate dioxygenase ferredoxin component